MSVITQKLINKKSILILAVFLILLISIPLLLFASLTYANDFSVEREYYRSSDDTVFSGIIYRPDPDVFPGERPGIIGLHDFMESKESMKRYAENLVSSGYVVLLYDQRGFGNSEGRCHFADVGYELKDLDASISFLQSLDYVDADLIGTFGMGYGASIAIMGAGLYNDKINTTFAINPYYNLTDTFDVNYNSLQGEIMKKIANDLGYIPHLVYPNPINKTQKHTLESFLDMLSDIPATSEFESFFDVKADEFSFNIEELERRSPLNHLSTINNESLFLASGTENSVYPPQSEEIDKDLRQNYQIYSYYHKFEKEGHNILDEKLDYALINFFNFRLKQETVEEHAFLEKPYISELDKELNFEAKDTTPYSEDNLLLLHISILLSIIPLGFLIPFIVFIVLFYLLILLIPHVEAKRKQRQKRYITQLDEKESKKGSKNPKKKFTVSENGMEILIYLITLISLILIPIVGMIYLGNYLLAIIIITLIADFLISVFMYKKISTRKKPLLQSQLLVQDKVKNSNKVKENNRKAKDKIDLLLQFLNKNPFWQFIFVLAVFSGLVLFISFIAVPIVMVLFDSLFNPIFLNIITSSLLLTIGSSVLLVIDKSIFNPRLHFNDYGLSPQKILKGIGFGIYIVQMPVIILIIASYFLILPQPLLQIGYAPFYLLLPFIFLFFFSFDVVLRVLIQEKIKGNTLPKKIGEFCIGSLLYAQGIGLFGYLLFFHSNSTIFIFSGLSFGLGGLFGFMLIFFSAIGTLNYMVIRSPLASSTANTLILFAILVVIL
ncbi:MAG: alpha/beta hydrolase [Promethearchaeia archaeon]